MTTIARALVRTDDAGAGTALQQAMSRLGPLRVAGLAVPTAEVSSALAALLDQPIGNIALRAWTQHGEIEQACRRTSANPGSREVVRLLKHRIVSRQSPVIEALVDGAPVPLIELDLLVEIEASSADLVIEHGMVADRRAGTAIARAKLSASDLTLAEHEFQPVDLTL